MEGDINIYMRNTEGYILSFEEKDGEKTDMKEEMWRPQPRWNLHIRLERGTEINTEQK